MNPAKRERAIKACERKLNRYAMSLSDLSEAISILDALSKLDPLAVANPEEIELGLKSAAVVAYCRPFLKSDQGALNESERRVLFRDFQSLLTSEEIELHKELMSLRNNVVAHSAHDLRRPKVVFTPHRRRRDFSYLSTRASAKVSAIDAGRLLDLAMALRSHLADKAGELTDRLWTLSHGSDPPA